MNHQHYSPYKFGTSEQLAEPPKVVRAQNMEWNKLAAERNRKTRNLGCTLPHSMVGLITSMPNAYISPNGVDTMRTAKALR